MTKKGNLTIVVVVPTGNVCISQGSKRKEITYTTLAIWKEYNAELFVKVWV